MSKKLSKRQRYVLRWNGPACVLQRKREYAAAKRRLGRGPHIARIIATAYVCRFRGFYPKTHEEMCRRADVPYCDKH